MALLLYDIDGTLLNPLGLGKRAFLRALAELYPDRDPGPVFHFDGMLDPDIVRRILTDLDVQITKEAVALLRRYLDLLTDERPEHAEDLRCPGVPQILGESVDRGHRIALLTGNVRRGAEIKLDFAGLGGYFTCGAFGEDAPTRTELVAVAMERVGEPRPTKNDVWLIGDSPRDQRAAAEAGVGCVLVGTGITPQEELREMAPDLLLDDLTDSGPLWAVIEGREGNR